MAEQLPTNETIRAVIESTIDHLETLGMDRENACLLLAIQGTIRLQSPAYIKSVFDLAADSLEEIH